MAKKKNNTFKSVDTLSKELDVVDNFVLKHWKRYAILAAAFVVILGIVLFVLKTRNENSIRSSEEVVSASTIAELQAVIKKYPDSDSINLTRLRLAAKLLEKKKYAEAVDVYNNIINSSPSSYTLEIAKLNKAYALEAEGKNIEAAKQLKTLANDTKLSPLISCQAAYSAGRIFNSLGEKQEALDMLQKCAAEKGKCQLWPMMAENLLCRIKK